MPYYDHDMLLKQSHDSSQHSWKTFWRCNLQRHGSWTWYVAVFLFSGKRKSASGGRLMFQHQELSSESPELLPVWNPHIVVIHLSLCDPGTLKDLHFFKGRSVSVQFDICFIMWHNWRTSKRQGVSVFFIQSVLVFKELYVLYCRQQMLTKHKNRSAITASINNIWGEIKLIIFIQSHLNRSM